MTVPAGDRFHGAGMKTVTGGGAGATELRGVGAGNRDRTGDIQLGKLAFYR